MLVFPQPVRLILSLVFIAAASGLSPAAEAAWPAVTATNKPWTRWWWLGSAVDKQNLTRELEAFAKAGIGGVEICPIYGAVGAEKRFIDFLSPEWMEMLAHTASEAKRLGLMVDMTTGTGWPFGGPMVKDGMASSRMERVSGTAAGGTSVSLKIPEGTLQCLMAFDDTGKSLDLTGKVVDHKLDWTPPPGTWTISGISFNSPVQQVKRSAPGGAGDVLDPFSPKAMDAYLTAFDKAFKAYQAPRPRAQFHDSFEYYGADWTPEMFGAFKAARGYDLRGQLPAFNGTGDADTIARVRADYRQTLGELHRDYLKSWHDWANRTGGLTRNQAHGSPGNLLDHYAVADIPETEIFRHVGEDQIPMLRFAASAANATGRNLVSSETFTWLDEHFQVRPEKLKEAADFVFLGGVNHLFFHGIPYSPADAPWPGWLFYASTHMGPNGGLWKDLPAFNGYIQRCQSILQEGRPDSDVLLYFPFSDLIHDGQEKLPLFTVHNQNEWLHPTPFYQSAMELWERGVTFDFASDDLLQKASVEDGRIVLGNNRFKVLVISGVKRMPVRTMRELIRIHAEGGKVVFHSKELFKALDVPGFHEHGKRKAELNGILMKHFPGARGDLQLLDCDVKPEAMRTKGLRFVRRARPDGFNYFVVNTTDHEFSGSIPLSVPFQSAMILDPWKPDDVHVVTDQEIPLRLAPQQSIIIRTFKEKKVTGKPWKIPAAPAKTMTIDGPWDLEFVEGGPVLPKPATLQKTISWTALPDPNAPNFSGTARYSTEIVIKDGLTGALSLDLGKVGNTARVELNGKPLGISWCEPHIIDVTGLLKSGSNRLVVEVTNLAANRIADLDRRKVPWKQFHEINFVNIEYKPFDASHWAPLESGLIGPVRLLIGGDR